MLNNMQDNLMMSVIMMKENRQLLEAILVTMSTKDDIKQMSTIVGKRIENGLNQPAKNGYDGLSQELLDKPHIGNGDVDRLLQEVFVELREFDEDREQYRKTLEHLPEMRDHRAKTRNMHEADKIIDWIESGESQILWINGNNVLGRYDFNSHFVTPLLLFGDNTFESVIVLRHFCSSNPMARSNNYRTLVQALLLQIFK
jgi:hypothetical protein